VTNNTLTKLVNRKRKL